MVNPFSDGNIMFVQNIQGLTCNMNKYILKNIRFRGEGSFSSDEKYPYAHILPLLV